MRSKKIKSLSLIILLQTAIIAQTNELANEKREWEVFPIANYDTDVGFGYGAKAFLFNFLNSGESIDLTAYNSTKGERWYRLVYSVPDMQRRQGKEYDFAFDLIFDYDKWINYYYYFDQTDAVLPNTNDKINYNEKEKYIREPIEIRAIFSRAFTKDFIAEIGLKYMSISCYNFNTEGQLQYLKPTQVEHLSLLLGFRVDTRTNFIDPGKGALVQIYNEYAQDILSQGNSFYRLGLTLQSYLTISDPKIILASRLILQTETESPYQNQLALGGNNSIRGLAQDRYLSHSLILLNEEIRFPILWRVGGVVGVDIGNSQSTPDWVLNTIVGLRFNMDNFIVRADMGFGKESTGFYFNFGHLF